VEINVDQSLEYLRDLPDLLDSISIFNDPEIEMHVALTSSFVLNTLREIGEDSESSEEDKEQRLQARIYFLLLFDELPS
jgi:hypothetical protein